MTQIALIAHNLRSTHNVGSLLRTADGLGVKEVYLTGYTPYPVANDDTRLPHIAQKLTKQIAKTALGAEKRNFWHHYENIEEAIQILKTKGYVIAGLEQSTKSIPLSEFVPPAKIGLIVGREVEGIEPEVQKLCDVILEIPMVGQKESFNVSVAAAMALYHLTFRGGDLA